MGISCPLRHRRRDILRTLQGAGSGERHIRAGIFDWSAYVWWRASRSTGSGERHIRNSIVVRSASIRSVDGLEYTGTADFDSTISLRTDHLTSPFRSPQLRTPHDYKQVSLSLPNIGRRIWDAKHLESRLQKYLFSNQPVVGLRRI